MGLSAVARRGRCLVLWHDCKTYWRESSDDRGYFFMSGGRPTAPCWPIGRFNDCSYGSLV